MITDAVHLTCWRASLAIAAHGERISEIEIEWDRRASKHGVVRSMRIEFERESEEEE